MSNIVVGSTSERKITITKKIFSELLKSKVNISVQGYKSNSGVPDTPYDQQTFDGSVNRARDCKNATPDSNFWVGLESGLVERYGHLYEEAWCTIITENDQSYYGYSSGLKIPDFVLQKMKDHDIEHGEAMSLIRKNFTNLPDNSDTWSNYTGGIIVREISLEESIRNALIQIVAPNHSFYKQ